MERNQKKKFKDNKGITLIALVVTIIVLLILAAVSLGTIFSGNGLFSRAEEAALEHRAGKVEDEVAMWKNEKKMAEYSGGSTLSKDELIAAQKAKELLTDEEAEQAITTGIVQIGSKTIDYGFDDIEKIVDILGVINDYGAIGFTSKGRYVKVSEGTSDEIWNECEIGEEIAIKDISKIYIYNSSYGNPEFNMAFALTKSGELWAWGCNYEGLLGIGSEENITIPTKIQGLSNIEELYSNGSIMIAKTTGGELWGWGINYEGQLGIGSKGENITIPTKIQGLSNIEAVYIDDSSITIAKTTGGELWAWGSNYEGLLGIGSEEENITIPTKIEGINNVSDIYSGGSFTIAKTISGELYAWGTNYDSAGKIPQLGIGSEEKYITIPTKIEGITNVADIYMGGLWGKASIIVRTISGELYSWGGNSNGVLGIGSTEPQLIPKKIDNISNVEQIYWNRSFDYIIARTKSGELYSWGNQKLSSYNTHIPESIQTSPMKIEGVNNITDVYMFTRLDYDLGVLAKSSNGELYAWGEEDNRLGIEQNGSDVPVKVDGINNVSEIYTEQYAGNHDCYAMARTTKGELYAWGRNSLNQLGISKDYASNVKTPVCLNNINTIAIYKKNVEKVIRCNGGRVTYVMTRDGKCYLRKYETPAE